MPGTAQGKQKAQASGSARGRATSTRRPSQGQKTTSKGYEARAANRKARGATHAKGPVPSATRPPRRATASVGLGGGGVRKRSTAKGPAPQNPRATAGRDSALATLAQRLLANKTILAVCAVIAAILLVGAVDALANLGKAYGNVSVNGMDVGGMNAEQIRGALEQQYGSKLPASKVTVYASEEARERAGDKHAQEENAATAEQISAEDAKARVTSWTADGSTLRAALPYDQVIDEALSAGRKGGPIGRLAVMFGGEDVGLSVSFDEQALDDFASEIDATVGNARQDATVAIEGGRATAVEGNDGAMVDRPWLAERLSDVMLEKEGATYVIAETSPAPSRTTMEQAESMRDAVNRALSTGASFTYGTNSWNAGAEELGSWTRVDVVESDGGFGLSASIDANAATSSLVKNMSTSGTSQAGDTTVDFEKTDAGITVSTSGSGEVPEIAPAVERVNEALYGEGGVAWSSTSAPQPVKIEIGRSDAPEQLAFDQAVELGIVTVIGEYTTEFSNDEGTENRNHNIRLVSDILNDTICESDGGRWSFNTLTGDTNLDPPFASAGSIVNGEYVDSIGGGICQVATTIFNAVFEAGLDVVERRNHSLYIGSYPTGRDVGVSYPELDFVWENKLKSDVLLQLSYTDTTVTAKLYGVYTGYKVESDVGEWEEGSTYGTEFEEDDTLAKGDYYIKTVGEDGSKISVTRTVTDKDGNIVSETQFDSVYEPKNEVYVIGPGTDTAPLVHTAQQRAKQYEEEPGYSEEEAEEGEPSYDEYPEDDGLYYDDSEGDYAEA